MVIVAKVYLGTLMVPELTWGQGLAYTAKDLREVIASLWVNLPQSFKLKFMAFYNAHMRI